MTVWSLGNCFSTAAREHGRMSAHSAGIGRAMNACVDSAPASRDTFLQGAHENARYGPEMIPQPSSANAIAYARAAARAPSEGQDRTPPALRNRMPRVEQSPWRWATPRSSSPQGGSATKIPRSSSPQGGSATTMPRSSSPQGGSAARMPRSSSPQGGSATKKPRSSSPKGGSAVTMPRSSSPKGGSAAKMPRSSSPQGGSATTMPRSSSPKGGSATKIPRSSSPQGGSATKMPHPTTRQT